jgi:hypothetical protein
VHLAECMVLVVRLRVVGITVLSREFVTESIFATTKKATTMLLINCIDGEMSQIST